MQRTACPFRRRLFGRLLVSNGLLGRCGGGIEGVNNEGFGFTEALNCATAVICLILGARSVGLGTQRTIT